MIIRKADYIISGTKESHFPKLDLPEFVFVGRSNVGKSSLINAVVGRKKLAYTSGKPGKTQTINFYNINNQLVFVDVPGYGYAKRAHTERQHFGAMIEEYLKVSAHLQLCFLIVDARHEPTSDDILMYRYLKHFNQKVVIIATKIDKIGKTIVQRSKKIIKETLELEASDDIIMVSSETKVGIDQIHQLLEGYINEVPK